MLSNEQKKEFINKFCEEYISEPQGEQWRTKIRDVFLADTKNGKMYKYRSVNINSLSNLIEGTLYCAKPSSFNDPFDCKMGFDITSLMNDVYPINIDGIEKYIIKYIKMYLDNKNNEKLDEVEKCVFARWENNNKIIDFMNDFGKKEMSNEEIGNLLITHFNIIFEFIKGYVGKEEYDIFIDIFLKRIETLVNPEILNKMNKEDASIAELLKIYGINDNADEISRIKMFCQSIQPDEMENAEKLDDIFHDSYINMSNLIDNSYRIGSLCTDYSNRLMWSHYADKHQGFCVEYDFNQETTNMNKILCLPVIYANERVKVPWKSAVPQNINNKIIQNESSKKILLSLLTKDEIWKYENEWRILLPVSMSIENVKMPPITCIYLGALCRENDRKILMKIADYLKIPVKQMVIDRGEYKLHAQNCYLNVNCCDNT